MTTLIQQIPSEKLKRYSYLIKCLIQPGAFSGERKVIFPCYDSKNRLGVDYILCHPSHLDEENLLCRVDLLRREFDDKVIIGMNDNSYKVHLDSLVENS